MDLCNLKILAPLNSFCWSGDDWILHHDIKIVRKRTRPDLQGLEKTLGEDERRALDSVKHWLEFGWNQGNDVFSAAEIVNVSLLSLWLSQPTPTHVSIRFEFDVGNTSKSRIRLLDRFQWLESTAEKKLDDADLTLASQLFTPLLDHCRARSRLNNAAILTMAGCWANAWQTALICHSAALEALLTYSKGGGLTQRLATVYACLVGTDAPSRNAAFREFKQIYGARSDIMHGRMHEIAAAERLPLVGRIQAVTRTLWRQILQTPSLATTLEETDAVRKEHFMALCNGYVPP